MTGRANFWAILATPAGALPKAVWPSNRPSPVMTSVQPASWRSSPMAWATQVRAGVQPGSEQGRQANPQPARRPRAR